MKDSADGLGILDLGNGQLEIVPTEVKSRVAVNTFIRKRMSLETYLGVDTYSPTKRHYRFLKSSDIKKWIPSQHEDFQLLHHVYCYGSKRGLMLIGSDKLLLCGFVVDFDPELLQSWEKVIRYVYKRSLKWAYKPSVPTDTLMSEETQKQISAALESSKSKMDMGSFLTIYGLWRRLNVDVETNIKFPLPKMDRLIPYQHSFWNVVKPGSDTITKLLD